MLSGIVNTGQFVQKQVLTSQTFTRTNHNPTCNWEFRESLAGAQKKLAKPGGTCPACPTPGDISELSQCVVGIRPNMHFYGKILKNSNFWPGALIKQYIFNNQLKKN